MVAKSRDTGVRNAHEKKNDTKKKTNSSAHCMYKVSGVTGSKPRQVRFQDVWAQNYVN